MRSLHIPALLVLMALLVAACGKSYSPNATASFEIGGICQQCPASRLDTLLSKLEGVVSMKLDSSQLSISYDSTVVKRAFLISVLNDAGYDADENLALLPTLLDPCCRPSLIKQKGEGKDSVSVEDDPLLDDDLSLNDLEEDGTDGKSLDAMLDDELSGVLEDDLLNESELGLDDDLLGNDAEDELDELDKDSEEKEKKDGGKGGGL